MAYDGKIMRRAMARWQQEKQRHADEIQQRKVQLYAKEPRLRQIEAELGSTMSKLIAGALSGGSDPLPAIKVLRTRTWICSGNGQNFWRRTVIPWII